VDAWTDYGSKFHTGKDNVANPEFFKEFRKTVTGAKIIDSSRRGKNVLVHLSNNKTILIHMKMTGHVMYGEYKKTKITENTKKTREEWQATEAGPLRDDPFNKFVHFVLAFKNGKSMVMSDMRKFAKVTLVDTNKLEESSHLSTHGPEPLETDFTVADFKKALMTKPNGPIKTVLMNHEIISGVGNIYSDEILWRASVHPFSKVGKIPAPQFAQMFTAMKATLQSGIDFGGDSMSDYRNIHGERGKFQERHNAYRKTGKPCSKPKCTGTIRRLKMGGRSAHYCDSHQKLYT
jgi:formamidopyrimidine-DNA glycosylase